MKNKLTQDGGTEHLYRIEAFCRQFGYTEKAVRRKIETGKWRQNHEWIKAPDGHVLIDTEGFKKWAKGPQQRAASSLATVSSISDLPTRASSAGNR